MRDAEHQVPLDQLGLANRPDTAITTEFTVGVAGSKVARLITSGARFRCNLAEACATCTDVVVQFICPAFIVFCYLWFFLTLDW